MRKLANSIGKAEVSRSILQCNKVNKRLNPSPPVMFGEKRPQYYQDFLLMADTHLHEQVFELICGNIEKSGKILVLGSGQGAMDQRLKDYGYDVLSADIAREGFKAGTELVVMDFNDFDKMNDFAIHHANGFAAVVSLEIIEHIENIYLYFDTIRSVVKKGGWLFVSTPNVRSWISRLTFLFKGELFSFSDKAFAAYGHLNPMTESELVKVVKQKGFDNIRTYPGGLLPKLWFVGNAKSMIFHFLGFILRPLMRGKKDGWCIIMQAMKI
jgi:2-polyprenyl-3-methyl-5-hydroxy-6-metoxy-1,4-benzoquinol methylase